MKPYWLLLTLAGTAMHADDGQRSAADNRINLAFTPLEQADFLAEMRTMLVSVQGIMQGIGESDRTRIAESARLSGNRMARATPASIRAKLPQAFRDMGGPTHLMFEELAVRAETDEMDSLALQAAQVLKQCVACHATFRIH